MSKSNVFATCSAHRNNSLPRILLTLVRVFVRALFINDIKHYETHYETPSICRTRVFDVL